MSECNTRSVQAVLSLVLSWRTTLSRSPRTVATASSDAASSRAARPFRSFSQPLVPPPALFPPSFVCFVAKNFRITFHLRPFAKAPSFYRPFHRAPLSRTSRDKLFQAANTHTHTLWRTSLLHQDREIVKSLSSDRTFTRFYHFGAGNHCESREKARLGALARETSSR